ncbi:MAG: diguanylate cyclase, partial [Caloramator sp.]|nr:diguanylate cyclase [Caloramator sp.]
KESRFDWIEYYSKIAGKETENQIEHYFDLWDRWCRIDVFSPEKGYFATLFNDITDIKKTTDSLREQQEVLRQITENLEEATFLQDVKTREVAYASSAFERIYEMSLKEMRKDVQKWKQMVHPDDYEKVKKRYNMETSLKEMYEKGIFVEKFRIITKSGKLKWIKSKFLPIKNENGEIIRVVGIEDITRDIENKLEIIKQKVKAENMAMRDYLTNLYNRRAFFQLAEERCKRAKGKGNNLVLVMTDIDKFKSINDNYGHDVGDQVLKNFAEILKTSVREKDLVARFGGEEFIILLSDIDIEDAYNRIEQLRKKVSETEVAVLDKKIKYTASFGISKVVCCGSKSFEEAIKRADTGLYKAKENGRNKVEIIN